MQGQHQLAALVNNWTILGLDSKNSISNSYIVSTLGRVYKGSQPFQAYCCKRKVCSRDMDIRSFFGDASAPSTSASNLSCIQLTIKFFGAT